VLVDGGTELLKDWFQFCEVSGGHSLRTELPYAIFQATQHKMSGREPNRVAPCLSRGELATRLRRRVIQVF